MPGIADSLRAAWNRRIPLDHFRIEGPLMRPSGALNTPALQASSLSYTRMMSGVMCRGAEIRTRPSWRISAARHRVRRHACYHGSVLQRIAANELALVTGKRLLSSYSLPDGARSGSSQKPTAQRLRFCCLKSIDRTLASMGEPGKPYSAGFGPKQTFALSRTAVQRGFDSGRKVLPD